MPLNPLNIALFFIGLGCLFLICKPVIYPSKKTVEQHLLSVGFLQECDDILTSLRMATTTGTLAVLLVKIESLESKYYDVVHFRDIKRYISKLYDAYGSALTRLEHYENITTAHGCIEGG